MPNSQNHIKALKEKHANLEQQIKEENLRPHPDEIILSDLKKQKLRLKEEIEMNAANAH